jgi:hypothetical protein
MTLRSSLRFVLALAGLTAAGTALAQTAECQRYRAELAGLERGRALAGAAQQQGQEIARLSAYSQSIGCGRGGFLFFGEAPECGAIAQRINMMQASYGRLAAADLSGSDTRRRHLFAAIQQACNPSQEAASRAERLSDSAEQSGRDRHADTSPRGLGGGRTVCVRACDGYAFPLSNRPASGRDDGDDMCQALCPGASTAAYTMPGGPDADLSQAVSLSGKRYTRLANAFKFQKTFDESCSCRKAGQSWAEALQKAERMIEHGRGDVIVTARRAEELSRPKLAARKDKPARTPGDAQLAAKTLDVETTGSIAKAKLGADGPALAKVSYASETASPATEDGTAAASTVKQTIRVIGPNIISVPPQARAE